jgi:hypothetical protein
VTPTKGVNTNTHWFINNVINPSQVSFHTYNQLLTTTFIMYSSYRTAYITKLNQPSFASYALQSDFVVGNNPAIAEHTANFNYHRFFPMTFDFSWNLASNSYTGRNISYIILHFTSGVRYVEDAWFRYAVSPFYTNALGYAKVGFDTTANQWYVNITGVMDSVWSSTFLWYVRVRLYANGNANNFHYTSSVFNFNGNLEFSSSSGSESLPGNGWSSSSNFGTLNTWAIHF